MTTASHTPAGLLRWLVEAPPLLPCPSPSRDAGELLKREYQLDPDLLERAALRLQTHTPARRLGLLFEQWVSALVDASRNLERVASNLPFRHQGRTPGELAWHLTGFWLPVSALEYWSRGLVWPGAPAQSEENDDGRLSQLSQLGWDLEFDRYQTVGRVALPHRIKARQGADSFTLLIREWQPLPSQP